MPQDGPDAGRWRCVWLECSSDGEVARHELAGIVAVDEARLMFIDVDALSLWQHEQPLDGRADFVFWGRDAERAAHAAGAAELGNGQWGWVDLPVREAVQRGIEVEELREQQGCQFATDFRPHSHHYLVGHLLCVWP